MATDLSNLSPGLTPESQAATNSVSSNEAMTAPGTASEGSQQAHAGDPLTSQHDAHQAGRTHLEHGGDDVATGHGWENVSGRRLPWGPGA